MDEDFKRQMSGDNKQSYFICIYLIQLRLYFILFIFLIIINYIEKATNSKVNY